MAKLIKDEKTRKEKTKAQVVQWLKTKGHKAADVDKEMLKDLRAGLRGLLSVSAEEYIAAGGKLA